MVQLLITMGAGESAVARWLALLLTYFVHALIWTVMAALLIRLTKLSARSTNTMWKLTFLGPLGMTLLSAVLPWSARSSLHEALPHVFAVGPDETAAGLAAVLPVAEWLAPEGLAIGLLLLFSASSFVGLMRFASAAQLLARSLRGRRPVDDARLLVCFERVRQRTPLGSVALTESANLAVPCVLGVAEVCIPRGKLQRFDDDELTAIFAHELAHLERWDGLWFPLFALLQATLSLQPLNHLLAAKFRESAELACDDRAVELTRAPLSLARALTRMAELALQCRQRPLVPAMVVASAQVQRVRRLLAAQEGARRERPRASVSFPVGCLLLLGVLIPSLQIRARTPRVATADAAGASAFADEMYAFVLEEQRLTAELEHLSQAKPSASHGAKLLELEQDLRHVRALQAWKQARYEQAHEAGPAHTELPAKSRRVLAP